MQSTDIVSQGWDAMHRQEQCETLALSLTAGRSRLSQSIGASNRPRQPRPSNRWSSARLFIGHEGNQTGVGATTIRHAGFGLPGIRPCPPPDRRHAPGAVQRTQMGTDRGCQRPCVQREAG